jgi:hypothetical protein
MVLRFIQTALILIISGFANAQTASLTLSLQDSSMFIIELNGVSYNDASNSMNISKLNPGDQKLKVIKLMQMGSSVVKKPVFEGSINLPANKTTIAYIDQYNQFRVSGNSAIENKQSQNQTGNSNAGKFVPNPDKIDAYTLPETNRWGMKVESFGAQIETLKSISSESQRYKTAIGYISIGTLNSNQIAEMMLTLSSEKNRIRLADFGQQYVTDKDNYSIVFNALRSPSSMRKLNRRLN